ncbi:MAG: aminotransferase class I/II-fold pyridoxal phosphate-dependent enzyme [Candidatus Latescibacter sp.]|nr:aminotransferase class I/II-fold pyridoxal phosphate-dependent enzyme [Candidatus Latescibacter sp.]
MNIRRFIMEDWLASYKDTCIYNLGESGMPDCTVGALLERCGLGLDSLASLVLKDNDTRGSGRLRRAILSTYHQKIGFEQITVTTGTSEALFILFNLLLNRRSRAVVPLPSFQALYEVPRALGAELRFYLLRAESGFLPDPDEICRMIDDRTGVVVINTPHNPSGRLFPKDAAETVIRKAAFHGATVISDEHYRFLPLNGESPLRTLARPDENVIAAGSLTKCFGVIGLRVGWIAAPEKLIAKVRDFRDYLTHTLSPVSDFLAAAALEHVSAFIEPNRETLRRNLAALEGMVKETDGISLILPEAGAVAFPAFKQGISSDVFARGLMEKHGVFVLPGSTFETESHFRINLGQEPDSFRRALKLIGEYCAGLEGA